MIYLTESEYQAELSQAEKGDEIWIKTTRDTLNYSTVVGVSNDKKQITIVNNNLQYFIDVDSAIQGNTFKFLDSNGEQMNFKFKRIDIKKKNGTSPTVHIVPQSDDEDDELNKDGVDKDFINDVQADYINALKEMESLEVGNRLYIYSGEWEFENGEATGDMVEDKDSRLIFEITDTTDNKISLKLIGTKGNNNLDSQVGNIFTITRSNDSFKVTKDGLVLIINVGKNTYAIKYVYVFQQLEVSKVQEMVARETAESRKKFHATITSLKKGDTLTVKFADMDLDLDDPNSTPDMDLDDESVNTLTFEAHGQIKGYIYGKIETIKGPDKTDYQEYEDEYFFFPLNEELFSYDVNGVILNTRHLDDTVQFKYVFFVESDNAMDDDFDDEDIEDSKMGKMSRDKDMMRLIHHKTWRDRLLGRNGVGVEPTRAVEKELGLNRRHKGHVELKVLSGDIKVGSGRNLYIKKDKVITGKLLNSDRIIIKSRNGKEEIQFYLHNTNKMNIYNVNVVHLDSQGQKQKYGKARIEILE